MRYREKVDVGTKEGFIDDVGSESEDRVSRRLRLQVKRVRKDIWKPKRSPI